MKNFILFLMAFAFVSCDKDWNDINPRKVIISDVNIECIKEVEGVHDPTSGLEYTSHTYKCTGSLDGFAGSCYIIISEPIKGECARSREIIVNKNKTDFAFTFTNKGAHTDLEHFNYTIQVVDKFDSVICQTTIIASKHPERPTAEPTDVPYIEYSLWGTQCEWQLPDYNNSIIVVDSDEELARYITSESGGKYPAVDFTKYTMIIAGGGASRGIYDVIVDSLQQLSDTEYSLNISVVMTDTDSPELWTKALLVDKWDKLCKVNLDVETIELID